MSQYIEPKKLNRDNNQRTTASELHYEENAEHGSLFNQEGMDKLKQNFGDGEFQPEMFIQNQGHQNQDNHMPNDYQDNLGNYFEEIQNYE